MATARPGYPSLAASERLAEGLLLAPLSGPLSPLSMLLTQACALLPIGPVELRVAAGFALVGALCALAVYRIVLRLLDGMGLTYDVVSVPLSVCAAWTAAGTSALFQGASAADCRAIPLCLSAFIVERLSAALGAGRDRPAATLAVAALMFGALCIEAPVWAVFSFVAAVPAMWTMGPLRSREGRLAGALLALGLSTALLGLVRVPHIVGYLPAILDRVAALPETGLPPMRDLWTLGVVACGVLGTVLAVREGATVFRLCIPSLAQGAAALLGLLLLPGDAALQAIFWPALVLAAVPLACVILGALLRTGAETVPGTANVLLVLALCVVAFLHLQAISTAALAEVGFATDTLMEASLSALPSDSVVLLDSSAQVALTRAAESVSAMRPDVQWVERPAMGSVRYVDTLLRAQDALRPLLSSLLLDGELSLPELQSLSGRLPLVVGLQAADASRLSEALRPLYAFYEVLPGGVTQEDLRSGGEMRAALYERLYAGHMPRGAIRGWLRGQHRADALHAMTLGGHDAAQAAIGLGLVLEPDSPDFMNLARFLADHADQGRLDVSPLIKPAPGPR